MLEGDQEVPGDLERRSAGNGVGGVDRLVRRIERLTFDPLPRCP
jgi:hypothetical protein